MEILMAALGLATHFIKAMMQSKMAGGAVSPIGYWKSKPYQSALSVIGCVAGYFALVQLGELSAVTAFGVGYMANSMADVMGGRATSKIG